MFETYTLSTLRAALTKIGLQDICDKDTILILKQDFTDDDGTLWKAGSLFYLNPPDSFDLSVKHGRIKYRMLLRTPDETSIIKCYIYPDDNIIRATGLTAIVDFQDLFEIYNGNIASTVYDYWDCKNLYSKLDNKHDVNIKTAAVALGFLGFFWLIVGMVCCGSNGWFGVISLGISIVCTISIIFMQAITFDATPRGRNLKAHLTELYETIIAEDKFLCENMLQKEIKCYVY